jgi:hypothetical protein
MIHLVIDTSIYRTDPRRIKAGFKAIERMAVAGLIKLHIPCVVLKEFLTQQTTETAKHLKSINDGLDALGSMPCNAGINAALEQVRQKAETLAKTLEDFPEAEFKEWATRLSATIHPIAPGHGSAVMEAYFAGGSPFKGVKNRNDIPDSFIWQVILDIKRLVGELTVLVADKRFNKSVEDEVGMYVYQSIDLFIASPAFQAMVKRESTERVISYLSALITKRPDRLKQFLEEEIEGQLQEKMVSGPSVPEDNNEAMITVVEDVDDIDFDLGKIWYFGDGVFTVPFTLRAGCLLDYRIFIADYYALPDDKSERIYVGEWNDHYYDAEERYEVQVEGTLAIKFGANVEMPEISKDDVARLLEDAEITIDNIEELSIVEGEGD